MATLNELSIEYIDIDLSDLELDIEELADLVEYRGFTTEELSKALDIKAEITFDAIADWIDSADTREVESLIVQAAAILSYRARGKDPLPDMIFLDLE
jgi:hypothetical protein